MPIDSTPSQVATSALQAIPFGSIIGAPLKACIEAQAMAAQTSWQFIQEVGLNTDPTTGKKEAVNVTFEFLQNGRMAQLNVPLLTIVPIRISPFMILTSTSRPISPLRHPLFPKPVLHHPSKQERTSQPRLAGARSASRRT